ncbi:hypothetical protein INS49_004805 [Diaporthe citri]|uniref:uncharacterized protein n=1 Tax=Diaporthe citri TaxID=83186 RepID=UPI001C809450|nr:uncharacterized protein INS49_004805 [Diaporthe citri]KAG6354201.1 hypothetical protein INS49_004805 [Diaporthe citri]
MEVVITYYKHAQLQRMPIRAGFINLHVKSRVIGFSKSGLNTPPPSSDGGRRKKPRVRFNLDDDQEGSATVSTVMEAQDQGNVDLGDAQSICTALQGTSVESSESKCLGYLDSCGSDTFRHSFFGMAAPRPMSKSICVSTEDILSYPPETSATLVDQLRLARSFAMAVLKFHSTPWLTEYVSIRDISFFRFDDRDLSSCIRTAHLNFDFLQTSLRDDFPIPTEDEGNSGAIEDAKLAHGVRNLTLWGLGTVMYVLLEKNFVFPDVLATMTRLSRALPELKPSQITEWQLQAVFSLESILQSIWVSNLAKASNRDVGETRVSG